MSTQKYTKGFYFGDPQAESENRPHQSLFNYFEDYLQIMDQLKYNYIVVGRKGSGKSAIAKYIYDKYKQENNSHPCILGMEDFKAESFIQKMGGIDNPSGLLFEWCILLYLGKLIIQSCCGKYTSQYKSLKTFLENNTGSIDIDTFQIDKIFLNADGEVSINSIKGPFYAKLKKYKGIEGHRAHFSKMVVPLREIILGLLQTPEVKTQEFWILFDDLDLGFDRNSDFKRNEIAELINILNNYNNKYLLPCSNVHILAFIRDDMADIIRPMNPCAKIFNSDSISIDWYLHKEYLNDENEVPLKKLANKRISINFEEKNLPYNKENPWNNLISEDYWGFKKKSSFKYILDYTFYRPRDIVTFLKKIGEDSYVFPLSAKDVKRVLHKYIKSTIYELKSELSLHFSDSNIDFFFEDLFNFILDNSSRYTDVVSHINNSTIFEIEGSAVIEKLYNYSIIEYKDNPNNPNKIYTHSRESENHVPLNKNGLFLGLHACIFSYCKGYCD